MAVLALIFLLSVVSLAQSSRTACSIGADAEQEFRGLPDLSNLRHDWEQRYGPRRTLAQRYPNDWVLQLRLQEPIRNSSEAMREWDGAIARYHSLPDHLLGDLLEARLLLYVQPVKSRQALVRIVDRAGDSPWAHFALLESASGSRNGDPALAEREYLTFRSLCPGERLIFRHLGAVHNRAALNGEVKALRTAIESAKQKGLDEDDYTLLQKAWTFERITYGQDRLNQFEQIVRSDLAYVRDRPNYESLPWFYAVSSGYRRILGDREGLKSLYNEVQHRAPDSHSAYDIQGTLWSLQNPPQPPPRVEPGAPLPQSHVADGEAYRAKQRAFLLPLVERFWGRPYAAVDARELLSDPGVPNAKFERLADFVLSNAERYPDQELNWPVQMAVAESYVDRKIRLGRVPALVAQAVKLTEDLDKYREESASNPVAGVNRHGRQLLIDAAISSGQMERAKVMLRDFRRELDLAQASTPDDPKRREDEFTYQMLAHKAGIEAPMNPELLAGKPREREPVPVAAFDLKDLNGNAWSAAGLKGKVTYICTWRAAPFVPCRGGLELVQALYERWKNRPDRAVLTISMDENAAIPDAFVKENGYSFPVIQGKDSAFKILGRGGWPMQWLIDPQARRAFMRPLRADDPIAKMEELADALAAAP